jgi:hypothetical protein
MFKNSARLTYLLKLLGCHMILARETIWAIEVLDYVEQKIGRGIGIGFVRARHACARLLF